MSESLNPFLPKKARTSSSREAVAGIAGPYAKKLMRQLLGTSRIVPTDQKPNASLEALHLTREETRAYEARRILDMLMREEHLKLTEFFGEEIEIDPLPKEITVERALRWKEQGFALHFLPKKVMGRDATIPGWEQRPSQHFYEIVSDPEYLLGPEMYTLQRGWILIDERQKPKSVLGLQTYEHDVLGTSLEELSQEGFLAHDHGANSSSTIPLSHSSRFGIPYVHLTQEEVRKKFCEVLGVKESQLRLPRFIEQNVVGNIHHPEWGWTDTKEWCSDGPDAWGKFVSGSSAGGGLSEVHFQETFTSNSNVGFRLMAFFPTGDDL